MLHTIAFYLFIVLAVVTIVFSFARIILDFDIVGAVPVLAAVRTMARGLPLAAKLGLVAIAAIVVFLLLRGFITHIERVRKK